MAIGRLSSYNRMMNGHDPRTGPACADLQFVPVHGDWIEPLDGWQFVQVPPGAPSLYAPENTFSFTAEAPLVSYWYTPDISDQFTDGCEYFIHVNVIDTGTVEMIKFKLGDTETDYLPPTLGVHSLPVVADFTNSKVFTLMNGLNFSFDGYVFTIMSITRPNEVYTPPNDYPTGPVPYDPEVLSDPGFDNPEIWNDTWGWIHDSACVVNYSATGIKYVLVPLELRYLKEGITYVLEVVCIEAVPSGSRGVYIGNGILDVYWDSVNDGPGTFTKEFVAGAESILSIQQQGGSSATFTRLSLKKKSEA
jgi:hypothetical protein